MGLRGPNESFNKIWGSVVLKRLSLKALITATAEDTVKHFFFFFFKENKTIHMKIKSYFL